MAIIIGFDNYENNYFLICLEENKWPIEISLYLIESMTNEKKIEVNKSIGFSNVLPDIFNQELINRRDYIYEIVSYLENRNTSYELYRKKTRKPIIEETINRYGISYNSIKKYLILYWKSGRCKDSLIPQVYKCGGKNKEKKILNSHIKRGRKGYSDGVNIDEKFKRAFKVGINKYYNRERQNTIKATYELTLRDFIKENGEVEILPSYQQFYYWFNKITVDKKKNEIVKRNGLRIYQQKGREIIGNSIQDAVLGPGELFQVDSTILDFYIVSSTNRNLIVGRPVVYIVIDSYSRLVIGVNVTLEPFNSYKGVRGALINTMTNKEGYLKKLGINNELWNVSSIPNRVLADRGELLSGNIENAIANLGIQIQNTPPYRGDYKGIVEKFFDVLHSYMKPFVDGYVENGVNRVERGAKDYRLKANLTLKEITQVIVKCIIFHNNNHVLDSYVGDSLSIEENIPKIPIKLWEYGIKNKKGLLRSMPDDIVKINLMNNAEAVVTEKGVKFKKLYYVSKYSLSEGWFQKARIGGSYKIKISYDDGDLSRIYFIKEDGFSFDTLELVNYLDKYKDLSEDEISKLIEYEEKLNNELKDKELKKKFELFNEIEEITNKAREEAKRTKDMSMNKSKRLQGIGDNLELERKLNREVVFKNDNEELDNDKNLDFSIFEEIENDNWSDYYE